jgi:hypothetical protein
MFLKYYQNSILVTDISANYYPAKGGFDKIIYLF